MQTLVIGSRVWAKDLQRPEQNYPSPGTIIAETWKSDVQWTGHIWKVHHDDGLDCWYREQDLSPFLRVVAKGKD